MLRKPIGVIVLAVGMSVAAMVMMAAPALAKGPSQARITGPGLAHVITVSGNGEPGQPGVLGTLAMQTSLFTVLFGASATVPPTTPDRLRTPPPNASLGPRYTIIYTVPGVTPRSGEQFGKIRQELYPHAANGPVIYTPPGQAGFGQPLQVTGWLRATPRLTRTLARLGVPRRAALVPRAHVPHAVNAATAHQAGSGALPWLIGAAAAIVAAVLAAALLLRHRKSATVHDSEPRTSGPAAGSA